jgi:hypothetical protein
MAGDGLRPAAGVFANDVLDLVVRETVGCLELAAVGKFDDHVLT